MRITVISLLCLFYFVTFAEANEDTYINDIVGIEISKPQEWFFMDTESVSLSRNRISLDDKNFERQLKSNARLPLVTICKYKKPETRLDVSPTVNVVYSKLGNLMALAPDELLKIIGSSLGKQFLDFKYELEPTIAKLSTKNAAKAIARYTLENQDGYIFKVRSEMWIVPKGDRVLIIGFASPAEGPDVADVAFESIFKSIKLR